jgi:hypothetical protein
MEKNSEAQEETNTKKGNIKTTAATTIITIIIVILLGIVSIVLSRKDNKIEHKWDKPIIYLYPTAEIEVTISLGNPNLLIHTYPKYNKEWNVLAKPNGDLVDINTNRNLYALYWEGINNEKLDMSEGFVVAGKDTIPFLEEKLGILGLNEREANEFIIYWLPKLENNKYNFIRFKTAEEIEKNMPLYVTPIPDTIIRVMMEFKALNKKIKVKEQLINKVNREGFVVVEWGGTEFK